MAKSKKPVSAPRGQRIGDNHAITAPKARTPKAAGGQNNRDNHVALAAAPPPTIAETIALIRAHHKKRQVAIEGRIVVMNRLGAYLRTALGWTLEIPAAERKRIEERANVLIDIGSRCIKGKRPDITGSEYSEHESVIVAHLLGCQPFNNLERDNEKRMSALVATLPVWERWAKSVRGLGPRSLATLVAEIGDLNDYATVSRVWKRMGVAVLEGIRQGGLSKSAGKDQWIEHGYKAKRRALLFVVGDCLVKSNGDGYYRAVYLARKQYESAKAMQRGMLLAPAARIPKAKREQYVSEGHIHKRAQRYMEKRLLKHLWQAWRAQEPDNDITVAA